MTFLRWLPTILMGIGILVVLWMGYELWSVIFGGAGFLLIPKSNRGPRRSESGVMPSEKEASPEGSPVRRRRSPRRSGGRR